MKLKQKHKFLNWMVSITYHKQAIVFEAHDLENPDEKGIEALGVRQVAV